MRDQARREAELILNQAHAEAREVQRRAIAENERLEHESRKLRAQLKEALTALGGPEQPAAAAREAEPAAPAADNDDAVKERSWYGLPDKSPLPDVNAA
jgi:hypothetical protein